jgi:hypothetical protein
VVKVLPADVPKDVADAVVVRVGVMRVEGTELVLDVRGIGKRGARQRLYECLTCCPDGIIEVCPACAASCHRGHDLRECDGALRGGDDDLAFCSCGFACACHTRCLP